MKSKVVIAVNSVWNIHNFRLGLINHLIKEGYDVVAVAPADYSVDKLEKLGCRFVAFSVDNDGTSIVNDFFLFLRYLVLLVKEKPLFYLGFTIKPNIYGSLASHLLGVNVVNNISGLGRVFIKKSVLTNIACILYKLALSKSKYIFFQNPDDKLLFAEKQLVTFKNSVCLPGSGINLNKFQPKPLIKKHKFRFLMVTRLLWDKGVREFVEAANLLNQKVYNVDFCLLGFVDVKNPASIPLEQIESWTSEGNVRYLGSRDDVRDEIYHADCVVLPSYREGTPKSLLEAAAMGRAIITTDAVGCREVVVDQYSGFLCRVGDAQDLAQKMEDIINLDLNKLEEMGLNGRRKMQIEYDEKIVFKNYSCALRNSLV